jgi:hypothetical protein
VVALTAHALAAAGAAVGVVAAGAWIAARLRLPLAAALPVGVAAWSVPLMLLAVAGWLDAGAVGLAGYACAPLLLDRRVRERQAWRDGHPGLPGP